MIHFINIIIFCYCFACAIFLLFNSDKWFHIRCLFLIDIQHAIWIRYLIYTYRYIDDALSINNSNFANRIPFLYPKIT